MAELNKCPNCGTELSPGTPGGHCLACLLRLGVETSEVPGAAASSSPAEKPGDRIGSFKLLQQIGEGGYGVVYMAEQEEPVRRRVALKIIKMGMDTKQVIARFEAERQALAMMDHPSIARVFEAGATETGRPYFVMELVRGVKITEYCDGKKYSTRQRLELFIQVCQAVQHAHQKGIVHRDLKPSNVLVTEQDGAAVPKIIDFGVAKAMYERLTDKTLFTAFDQFIGTPAYTSPEQAGLDSLDIDTRSDIYSLGVLLYELLTGKLPFEIEAVQRSAMHEVLRIIRETEPARPSARMTTLTAQELTTTAQRRQIEPARLTRVFQGDLDLIVMKTLEKDRRRRYETATGLAADLQRHLNHEPVEARPPGAVYRFGKMARRNKLAFTAVSSVIAALALGLGVSTWEYFQEKQARERAVTAESDEKGLRERAEQARNDAESARANAEEARANEARLRQRVEARVNVIQARALYDAKKYGEAEKLLDKIDAANLEVDSTHSDVRRGLIWNYIAQEKWPEAVSNIVVLLKVDGADRGVTIAQDRYLYANALAQTGDRARYDRFRDGLLSLAPTNNDGELGKFFCEITMLMPADRKALDAAGRFYDLGENWVRYSETGKQDSEALRRLSLVLVDYRRGDYAKAVARCQTCLSLPLSEPSRIPSLLAISAMARHQLHEEDAAQFELALARRNAAPTFEKGTAPYDARTMGYWMEMVETRSLLREAGTLIGELPAGVDAAVTNALAKLARAENLAKGTIFQDAPREQFEAVTKLIGEIPPPVIQVDGTRAAEMFTSLGRWHFRRQNWAEAVAQWDPVVYGPEGRGSLLTGPDLSLFYLSHAPALVATGDTNKYEKFRAHAAEAFGRTLLPVNAERVLTACLLSPGGTNLLAGLAPIAGVITNAKPPSAGWVPWGESALAMFEYRRGNAARALELIQRNLGSPDLPAPLQARFQILNVLAGSGTQDVAGALDQSLITVMEGYQATSRGNSEEWHDWWIDRILLEEAARGSNRSTGAAGAPENSR